MIADALRFLLVIALAIVVGALVWNAVFFNGQRNDTCKEHGLVMVKGYFEGGYGCAEIIPFDELEGK